MFATGDLLRSIIKEQLSSRIVHPNKIYVNLSEVVKRNVLPEINGIIRVLIKSVEGLDSFDDQMICGTIKLGSRSLKFPETEIKNGIASLNFECEMIDFADVKKTIEIVAEVKNPEETPTTFSGKIDVKRLRNGGKNNENHPLTPFGSITASFCHFTLSSNRKDLQISSNKSSALLEAFIDSPRKLPENKKKVFVKLSIANQDQETLPLAEDSKSWKNHFHFFLQNPESSALTVQLIDQQTSDAFANFTYKISELMARKNMQQELQAFPFASSYDCEVSMYFKLRAMKPSK